MVRQTLAQEITQYLTEQGAVRVGFADLHGVAGASLPYGITALVALPLEIVGPLVDQPHRAYYDAYQAINVRLDAMAEGCAALLRAHGYQATANTEEHLPTGAEDRSPLPHKAVACRAGLGWIGKNNLLTTPDFGGAVRLCTVVTDAPLPTAAAGCAWMPVPPLLCMAPYGTRDWIGTTCSTTCCVSAPQRSEQTSPSASPLPSAANASPCVPIPSDT